MPTYYKPTVRRGKRVVYKSTDPAEAKRDTIIGVIFIVGIILIAALAWFSSK